MNLLVSVRSAAEAEAALEGGAAVIDVKEPAKGPLGRAEAATVAAVLRQVAGRRPVSAALGELAREPQPGDVAGLAFVKWGLAGYGAHGGWQAELTAAGRQVAASAPGCEVVVAAYADWQVAGAPPVDAVVAFARRRPGGVLLVDTYGKNDGRTLLDWLSVKEVGRLCRACRQSGVRVALAGSLGADEIRRLLPARPDWFAVRGAACVGRDRRQSVRAERVRVLVELLAASQSLAPEGRRAVAPGGAQRNPGNKER
jgi:uncharacterized protein (UPF0264 family)